MLRESWLFLIEVNRDQGKVHRCDHDAIAFFNHVEVCNGFAHVTAQSLLQFIQVVLFFLVNLLIL
ncbi:Uncharacterised protein [Enterobacter cloacae]|nr:Uncharacterised protein [Enterobacter cloacae]